MKDATAFWYASLLLAFSRICQGDAMIMTTTTTTTRADDDYVCSAHVFVCQCTFTLVTLYISHLFSLTLSHPHKIFAQVDMQGESIGKHGSSDSLRSSMRFIFALFLAAAGSYWHMERPLSTWLPLITHQPLCGFLPFSCSLPLNARTHTARFLAVH